MSYIGEFRQILWSTAFAKSYKKWTLALHKKDFKYLTHRVGGTGADPPTSQKRIVLYLGRQVFKFITKMRILRFSLKIGLLGVLFRPGNYKGPPLLSHTACYLPRLRGK